MENDIKLKNIITEQNLIDFDILAFWRGLVLKLVQIDVKIKESFLLNVI